MTAADPLAVVDAHHHLWDPAARHHPFLDRPGLEPLRRPFTVPDLVAAAGPAVAATVVVQTVSSTAETTDLLAVAHGPGPVAGVVGWVDLTAPDLADRLPDDPLLVGVRHQVEDEADPGWLGRPAVRRGLVALGARGLVYDLLVRGPQRAAALDAARDLDGVTFVVDHAGKPGIAAGEWTPWARWIEAMAALPHVVCKLSGLVTEADQDSWDVADLRPYAEHVLDRFGADRVLAGSDWPVCELAGSYRRVTAALTELLGTAGADERAAVLGGTARRVYGLAPAPAGVAS